MKFFLITKVSWKTHGFFFNFQIVVVTCFTAFSVSTAQHLAYGGPGLYGHAAVSSVPVTYARPKAVAYAAAPVAKIAKGNKILEVCASVDLVLIGFLNLLLFQQLWFQSSTTIHSTTLDTRSRTCLLEILIVILKHVMGML